MFDAQEHFNCPRLKIQTGAIEQECDPVECDHSTWSFNGEDYIGCPVKSITQQSGDFIRAYRFFKYGILPRSGGLLDQGSRYVQAMEAIDREINLIAQEKEKRDRK